MRGGDHNGRRCQWEIGNKGAPLPAGARGAWRCVCVGGERGTSKTTDITQQTPKETGKRRMRLIAPKSQSHKNESNGPPGKARRHEHRAGTPSAVTDSPISRIPKPRALVRILSWGTEGGTHLTWTCCSRGGGTDGNPPDCGRRVGADWPDPPPDDDAPAAPGRLGAFRRWPQGHIKCESGPNPAGKARTV